MKPKRKMKEIKKPWLKKDCLAVAGLEYMKNMYEAANPKPKRVCVWSDDQSVFFHLSCKHIYLKCQSQGFKFCPFCGRKIKEVKNG